MPGLAKFSRVQVEVGNIFEESSMVMFSQKKKSSRSFPTVFSSAVLRII